MTALPATVIEAEAVEFARVWLARVHEERFLESPHGALDPAAAHWLVRRTIKRVVESHPLQAAKMVEAAVLGWGEADLALREVIAEKLDRGESLGAVLGGYAVRAVHPDLAHRAGRSKASNLLQDIAIATLVLTLIERFPPLKPTRSQAGKKRHPSACSIVAAVLSEAGMPRGDEKAVQQVWLHYGPIITFGYLWPDRGRGSAGFDGP